MKMQFVQYGCGLSAPTGWLNFDSSPTLRIQRHPILGRVLKSKLNVIFPDNIKYGDIIKGLPVADNSCDAIYCSHVLEHLSLEDFRLSLRNTLKILKPEGTFRCVVPDLEYAARTYINALDQTDANASLVFCGPDTLLGVEKRPQGFKGLMTSLFGNSHHLWMWDRVSLAKELEQAGFISIRQCSFNDSAITAFHEVEDEGRFINAVAIECRKPK